MDIENLKYEIASLLNVKYQGSEKSNYFNYYFSPVCKVKSEEELKSLFIDMRNNYNDLLSEYKRLYAEYVSLSNNHASNRELNKIAVKMNTIADKADVLYNMINIIQKSFTNKSTNKFVNNSSYKQSVVNKAITPNENYRIQNTATKSLQSSNSIFRGFKPEYKTNPITSEYFRYSYEISKKYIEYRNSNLKNDNVMKEISVLTNKRRKLIGDAFSTNSEYGNLYASLNEIEQMERDTYSDIDYNKYPIIYKNSDEYLEGLKNSFRKISETAFNNSNDTALRLSNMRLHNNMLLSVLDMADIRSKEYKKILAQSDSIINKIITYNIYGDDNEFLDNNKNNKIATQKVSLEMIKETRKSVEDEQKELFDQLMKRIKDKNSTIKINDCYITPAQKEQELFDKHFEMCGSIYKLNNNLVNRKG